MKSGIHPNWYPDAVVTCACGNTWTTGSTKKEIHTDVCNKCHPFFTGEQRIVDTAGQVERFMKRISAKEQIAATQPAPEDKKAKKEKRRERKPGTTVILSKHPAAPAELPLAVVEEKPAIEVPTMLVVESPKAEELKPVVEIEEPKPVAKIEEPEPVAMIEEPKPIVVEIPPVEMKVEEPAPVVQVAPVEPMVTEAVAVAPVEVVVEKKKTKPRAARATVKKAVAKKPAAKTAKPKAAAKPKTAAKKPAPAKKTSPTKKAKK